MISGMQAMLPLKRAVDRGTGTTAFSETRAILCNVDGQYQVTGSGNATAVTVQLVAGLVYPFQLTNILNSSGGALTAGDITLWY